MVVAGCKGRGKWDTRPFHAISPCKDGYSRAAQNGLLTVIGRKYLYRKI